MWNETLTIPVSQKMVDQEIFQDLKITCFDEDVIVHDKVGTAIFKIGEFTKFTHPTAVKLILKHNKVKAAEIHTEISFISTKKAELPRESMLSAVSEESSFANLNLSSIPPQLRMEDKNRSTIIQIMSKKF